jgi:hypothetical protein
MKSYQSPDPELLAAEEDDEDFADETDSALRRGMKTKMRSSLRGSETARCRRTAQSQQTRRPRRFE